MGAKGKILTEKLQIDYRALRALNQSSIKTFDEDPMAFYNEFILGISPKRKKGDYLIIGDMSDFYTLECNGDEDEFIQRLDEKFILFEGNVGTGQVFKLADVLADLTERDTNETGAVTTTFTSRFEEAFSIVQTPENKNKKGLYSGKTLAQGLEDFEKNGLSYFNKKIESFNKDVVTIKLIEIAKRVGNQLLNDPFTSWVYNGGDYIEVLKKFPITWSWKLINGEMIECKSEIDIMHIDHATKLILPKDQKVTYDNESFDYSYLKYKYYLQNAFYYLAVNQWRDENYPDYEVVAGMDFVVGDSSFNLRRPLVYTTSMTHIKEGLNGFTTKWGEYRKGIGQLVEEIAFCIDNSSWNCGKEAYENNGILKLKTYGNG